MGKYYGISSTFCGGEQEYLIDEVMKYRNDQYSLVSGGSQIQALMYDLRQHNFLLPSVSEGFSFPKSWTPTLYNRLTFFTASWGYRRVSFMPSLGRKGNIPLPSVFASPSGTRNPRMGRKRLRNNQKDQLPGASVGKGAEKAKGVGWRALPLFPFISGARKREVAISGLQCLHRENLEPLRIEDPTQESRDKWHTPLLYPQAQRATL